MKKYENHCDGKIGHSGSAEAVQALLVTCEKDQDARYTLTVYKCDWCNLWHVGNKHKKTFKRGIRY